MGAFPCFSAVFTKGNRFCDFPFALPDNVVLKKLEPTAANYFNRSWLVGCFGFNGPLRQYFSLYRAVSQREGERGEKG